MPSNIPSKSDENGAAEFISTRNYVTWITIPAFRARNWKPSTPIFCIYTRSLRKTPALSFALIPVSALILWDFYLLLTNPAYAFKPPFACGSDSSFLYHFSEHIHFLADSFPLGKEKSTSNEKVITGTFNVSFIDFLSLRYHCSRIFAKHSLQYTGRSDLGSNGTRASPPQEAQVAVKNSRGPRAAFLRASRHALQRCGSFWKPRSA